MSVETYLRSFVFDRPLYGETALGVQLTFERLRELQLETFVTEEEQRGDFGAIVLKRNPAAARIAQIVCQTNEVERRMRPTQELRLSPAEIDPEDLDEACRQYDRNLAFVRATVPYRLEIDFDAFDTQEAISEGLSQFFERPCGPLQRPSLQLCETPTSLLVRNLAELYARCGEALPWLRLLP